jgi:hypothetical protein
MKGSNEIYLEYVLGALSKNQIIEWAVKLLTSLDPLANNRKLISIAELKSINQNHWKVQPGDLLKEVVEFYFADFRVPSVESEVYARACLREKCVDFLVGTLHRSELFSVVENIHRLFDNPTWIGRLLVFACKSRNHVEWEQFDRCLKNEVKLRLIEL